MEEVATADSAADNTQASAGKPQSKPPKSPATTSQSTKKRKPRPQINPTKKGTPRTTNKRAKRSESSSGKKSKSTSSGSAAKKPRKKRASKLSTDATKKLAADAAGDKGTTTTKDREVITKPQDKVPKLTQFCTTYRAPKPKDGTREKLKKSKSKGNNYSNQRDDAEESAPAGPAVQIINGEIVLQESSLILHGNVKPPTEEEYQVVEEEDQLGGIGSTYTSFSTKHVPSIRWTVDETELFYSCLRQVGLDFSTMESFFVEHKRNRKALKRKYKQELIKNPTLVEVALSANARQSLDLSIFDVTESDVAAVEKPTAPIHEPTEEPESDKPAADKSLDNDAAVEEVVEENADDDDQMDTVVEEDAADEQEKAKALPESFWNEEKKQPESKKTQPTTTQEDVDPLLEEGDGPVEEPGAASISLLSATTSSKKKPKKPKFRSRKGKGK